MKRGVQTCGVVVCSKPQYLVPHVFFYFDLMILKQLVSI